jgi:hypothetical protein
MLVMLVHLPVASVYLIKYTAKYELLMLHCMPPDSVGKSSSLSRFFHSHDTLASHAAWFVAVATLNLQSPCIAKSSLSDIVLIASGAGRSDGALVVDAAVGALVVVVVVVRRLGALVVVATVGALVVVVVVVVVVEVVESSPQQRSL